METSEEIISKDAANTGRKTRMRYACATNSIYYCLCFNKRDNKYLAS